MDSFLYVICDQNTPPQCDTAWVYITVLPDGLIIPNGFSPNDDGDNDNFVIVGIDQYPNNTLRVFNRWGNIVYEVDGYNSEWDGTYFRNGEPVPDGTYYYVLDLGDGSKEIGGFIVIFR